MRETIVVNVGDNPRGEYPTFVAHSDFGDPGCCGVIMATERGDHADLTCNECGKILLTVKADEAEPMLLRLAMRGGFCSERCPYCCEVNTFPGFTFMEAYTCWHCGLGVIVGRSVN